MLLVIQTVAQKFRAVNNTQLQEANKDDNSNNYKYYTRIMHDEQQISKLPTVCEVGHVLCCNLLWWIVIYRVSILCDVILFVTLLVSLSY